MGSKQNLEAVREAINQLLVEEVSSHSVHRRTLLSELRSQLELLEQENCEPDESEQEAKLEETTSPSASHIDGHINAHSYSENDEVLKELKNLKKQNLITHGLLSAMIVVTLSWQLSEVSLILKIKHVLSSPIESLGGIVKRFLNGQPKVNVDEMMKQASSIKEKVSFEPTCIPVFKVPELPHLELPCLDTSEEE